MKRPSKSPSLKNGHRGAITNRAYKHRPSSRAGSRSTGTDTSDRPLTPSFNVPDSRRHHGLPKCYAISSVAEALNVSTRTIRRWIANSDLAVHRIDGVVRIAEADLRSFLAVHREG
jgi:excisionase family DNA binding protein